MNRRVMSTIVVLSALAGLWLAGGLSAGPTQETWVVRYLTVPDGYDGAGAYGIDNSGKLLGSAHKGEYPDTWQEIGVLWDNKDYELLGPPESLPDYNATPGPMSPNGHYGGGSCYPPPSEGNTWRAALWDLRKGEARDVHPEGIEIDDSGPCEYSYIVGVNNDGEAAGALLSANWKYRGYRWSWDGRNDALLPLLPSTTDSMAVGIDGDGNAVGCCWTDVWKACVWPAEGGVVDLHEPLLAAYPELEITHSRATGASKDGLIVGSAFVAGGPLGDVPETVLWHPDGSIEMLDRGGADSAWGGVAAGRFVLGQLGGTHWYYEDGETARAALWENGTLHVVWAPEPFGYLMPNVVNSQGDFTATLFEGDNFHTIDGATATGVVVERKSGK